MISFTGENKSKILKITSFLTSEILLLLEKDPTTSKKDPALFSKRYKSKIKKKKIQLKQLVQSQATNLNNPP